MIAGLAREIGRRKNPSEPFSEAIKIVGRFAREAQEKSLSEFVRIARESLERPEGGKKVPKVREPVWRFDVPEVDEIHIGSGRSLRRL